MAVRTVSNAGGNWNATTTWVGGVVPIAGDDVNFTATSGNLTVNVSTANLIGINFTNYVGIITFNNNINTNGTVNLGTGGYTQDGANGLVINGSATISGSTTWSRAFTISLSSVTVTITLSSNLNITGLLTLSVINGTLNFTGAGILNPTGNLTLSGSAVAGNINLPNTLNIVNLIMSIGTTTLNINGNSINVSGNLTTTGTTGWTGGTTNINLVGNGTWSNTSTSVSIRNPLTFNTSGTITISGNVYYGGNTITYTLGTITTTNSTLNIQTLCSLNTSGMSWYNITYTSGGIVNTLLSNLNITNNLTTSSTTFNGLFNVNVSGSLILTGTTTGTSSIVLNGTGTWSHTNTGALQNNLTINTSGTITLGTNIYYNTGILTYTAGTVTTTGSTLNISAATTINTGGMGTTTNAWNNVTLTVASTFIIVLSSNLNTTGTLTITSANTGQTLSFSGVGLFNPSGSLALNLNSVTSATFTITIPNTFTVTNLTFNCGTNQNGIISLNGNSINITGNLSQTNATFVVVLAGTTALNLTGTGTWSTTSSGSGVRNNLTINTSGTITISGSIFYNTGVLTYTTGTVTTTGSTLFVGLSTTLSTGVLPWNNVILSGVSTITLTSNLNVSGNLTTQTGAVTINGLFNVNVSGSLSINIATLGSSTIVLNGTGTWSHSSAVYLSNPLTINTSGTITVSGTVYCGTGTLTRTSGTVTTTSSTLTVLNTTTLNTGGVTWNNVTINVNISTVITLPSNLNTTGTLSFISNGASLTLSFSGVGLLNPSGGLNVTLNSSSGAAFTVTIPNILTVTNFTFNCGVNNSGTITLNGNSINITGNLSQTNGTFTVILLGTTNLNLTGTGTWSVVTASIIRNNLTINTAGTITISGNVYYNTGTLTHTSGTVTTTGSTLFIGLSTTFNTSGMTWNNVILAGTQTLSSGLNIGGNLTTQTTAVVLSGVVNVSVGGNLAINITTSGTATIILNGTGTQTWSHGSAVYLTNNLTINKSSGTLTIGTNVYYNTGILTYTVGTVNTTSNSSTLIIGGTTTLNTNGINWYNVSTPSAGIITLTSNLNILNIGNFRYAGGNLTFVSSTGTLSVGGDLFLGISTWVNIDSTTTLCNDLTVQSLYIYHYSNGNGGGAMVKILNINNSTINVSGNLTTQFNDQGTLNITGGEITGTANIVLNGTGTWVANNGVQYGWPLILTLNLTINTLGTITISGIVQYYRGTLTYISGSVITTGSTLYLISISGGLASTTLNTNNLPWNNIIIRGGLIIILTSGITINGTFTPTFSTAPAGTTTINGLFNINIKGTLQVNNTLSGTATIQLNGVWTTPGYNVFNNLSFNGNSTISGIVYYTTGILTYISGNIITKNSTLSLSTSTLINCHKINFDRVVITSGVNITMNEFFSGSPSLKTTITPSSTTNYIITFQDRFEKFSKFVKVSRVTISTPGQLTVTTDKGNQLNNVGVKFAPNQITNSLPKNSPSTNNINPNGLSPTYLVTDPTLS